MSAYAALVSLRQTLEKTLNRGGWRIFRTRGELRGLHEKVNSLVGFLENSSTSTAAQDHMTALEEMMIEEAYKAEDLIGMPASGVQDSVARDGFSYFLYAFLVSLILGNRSPVILVLGFSVGHVAAIVICTICAAFLHLITPQHTRDLRAVLKNFSTIEKEKQVVQNKEASAHAEFLPLREILDSVDAELISLLNILDSALDSGRNRPQLGSIKEMVSKLLEILVFIRNASSHTTKQKTQLQKMIAGIRGVKQVIESQTVMQCKHEESDLVKFCVFMRDLLYDTAYCLPVPITLTIIMIIFIDSLFTSESFLRLVGVLFLEVSLVFGTVGLGVAVVGGVRLATANRVNHGLGVVMYMLHDLERDANNIKDACGHPSDLPTSAASPRSDWGDAGKNVVVGRDDDLTRIKDCLDTGSQRLEVVSIVGMGGIGKTTLAREVYNDPYIAYKFYVRAWITVSPKYSLRQVLQGLLVCVTKFTEEMQEKDEGLGTRLYQNLIGRRYLIVIDDVWSTEIWDSLRIYLPETFKGSRVLLTSRLSSVANYPRSCRTLHQMQFLEANKSWDLLRGKVFGAEICPSELESIGREIAQRCGGLPLAIVVIGGLLYKDKRCEIWRDIAKNLNSDSNSILKMRYLEILGLSYNNLPQHLRPCFLYMGVFLGDSEIPVHKIISLWVAEGFLKPSTPKTLEEVAEDNLKELIDRNLIFVSKWSCNHKIRTCSMHGLLRDFSQKKARKENFLLVVDRCGNVTLDRRDKTQRRLSIRSDTLGGDAKDDLISYCNVRSLLCTITLDYLPAAYLGFMYLRVLDLLVIHFSKFPESITSLLLLRYLALSYDGSLPSSMSKLQNLETLVIHHHCSSHKYSVIWSMPNLRYLYVKPGCYLSSALDFRLPWKNSALKHLHTLVGVRNLRWSKGIIKRIPNLTKLGISYDVPSSVNWATYELESLVGLTKLEILKIVIKYNDEGSGISNGPPRLAFPEGLKKLILSGCGITWASMTTIGGELPNLEALKLRYEACSGSSWETVNFPKLTFLLLEHISLRRWETETSHFPLLRRLVIRSCLLLENIPDAVGDIPTLETIHLVDCSSFIVESAQKIQEEQENMGNDIKVLIGLNNHVP